MANEANKKIAGVYRISYDLNNSKWVAHVAAFSDKEAVAELRNSLPKPPTKIEAINHHSELDMVSKAIKNDLAFDKQQKIIKLKARIKELEAAKDLRTLSKKKATKEE